MLLFYSTYCLYMLLGIYNFFLWSFSRCYLRMDTRSDISIYLANFSDYMGVI
jgi:hypothetical protein